MKPLHAQGMALANDKQPTHGDRQIDMILFRGGKHNRRDLVRLKAGVVPGVVRDDHDYPWATFRFGR
jgi:hypothetical protein